MSIMQWVVVLVVVLVLFGAGRIPRVMGDIGRGIRNLREELDKGKQEVLPPDDKK